MMKTQCGVSAVAVFAVGVLLFTLPVAAGAFSFEKPEDTCGELCTEDFWYTATVEKVSRLLDQGTDVHAVNEFSSTPLHYAAAAARDPALVELLIQRGAEVDAQNIAGTGTTPLVWAAESGNLAAAKILLDAGATPHGTPSLVCCPDGGWSPLHSAAANGRLEMAELLISRGAHANAVMMYNTAGYTPLHAAAESDKSNPGIIHLLVKAGAKINARAGRGWTPLFYAVNGNNPEAVRKLLTYRRIKVNAKEESEHDLGYGGDTPLHEAVRNGHWEIVGILLNDRRTKVRIKNVAGKTPGDLIREWRVQARNPYDSDDSDDAGG